MVPDGPQKPHHPPRPSTTDNSIPPSKKTRCRPRGLSSVKKVRVRHATLLGKVDIGIPETMLPAMVVLLKPRCQRCRDSKILVTMAFWEADSRHAGELSVFFVREKANSVLIHIGQKVQKNIKSATSMLQFEVSVCSSFVATGDPLLPIGQTVGRLWAFAPRDTNRE